MGCKHKIVIGTALAFSLGTMAMPTIALAQDADDTPLPEWRANLKDDGVSFDLGYRSEDQAAVSGADGKDYIHAGQISLGTKFDMDKLVGWTGGSIVTSLTYRDGPDINLKDGIGALYSPAEIAGRGHFLRLTEFFIKQSLAGGKVVLQAGRMTPGDDFDSTDCNALNLSLCGNQPGNIDGDYWYNWPISQWGAVGQVNFSKGAYVKAAVYQENPRNLEGDFIRVLSFKGGTGVLVPVEFGWKASGTHVLPSSVAVGGWYSTSNRSDVYQDVNRAPAAETGLGFRQRGGSYGGYVNAMHQFTRGDGASARSGLRGIFNATFADRATSTIDHAFSGTLVYTGTFAGRPKDDIGVGIAFNHLNGRLSDYRSELIALGTPDGLPGGTERVVEGYYSIQLGSHIMLRPDAQWIHNAGGASQRGDVLVLGSRLELKL